MPFPLTILNDQRPTISHRRYTWKFHFSVYRTEVTQPAVNSTKKKRCNYLAPRWGGIVLAGYASLAGANELINLDSGVYPSAAGQAISADGKFVVGFLVDANGAVNLAARWDALTGAFVLLGSLGGSVSSANAVNATGDVIVGNSYTSTSGSNLHAFRWTASSNTMTDLGTLGGSGAYGRGVNAAGDVVVGQSSTAGNAAVHAYRWTLASNAMTDLGTLGGNSSTAVGVNAAGDVVVGESDVTGNAVSHAFRWTLASNAMADLGTLGGTNSYTAGVNAAGDVVVGSSYIAGDAAFRAYRWTLASNTMVDLGTLGGTSSSATGVNAAGNVVVGWSYTSGTTNPRGFRWTPAGMQSIEDWLSSNGVNVTGVTTLNATGTDGTGNIVIGQLTNNHTYIARVQAPSGPGTGGGGLIDVEEFNTGLAKVANSGLMASAVADTVMNGAHSNPMRLLLPSERSTFWVGGDAGRQDAGVYSNTIGTAEVGYGYRLNDALQFNISAGRTYNNADTGLGGRTTARSTYLTPEVILTLPHSVYATVTGYYGQGRSDIDRVYLNAGTPTSVIASPGVQTAGARLRLDWLNAASLGKVKLTPYTSLTYMKTRTDAYTEQGGAFPTTWNSRTDSATTARVGVDATYAMSSSTLLQTRLEAAHQFETKGATTSGQVIGLYGFSFGGQEIKQDWLRLGLGVESKIGSGIASLMLNGTTQGEAPSYWLAANYRWEF